MSTDLRDLYQDVILDHGTHPRNFHEMADADHKAEGYNPLCGDRVTIYLRLNDDTIADVSFAGTGCAICKSSCSMMTEAVAGKSIDEIETLFQRFHRLVIGDGEKTGNALGKLEAFAGVCEFPMRVKCATLPWHTLRAACKGQAQGVSTE